jgi:hypothetical protein
MSDENANVAPEPAGSSEEKPGAVTAFGVLHIVFGSLGIIGGIIGLAGTAFAGGVARSFGVTSTGGAVASMIIFAILALAVSIILLIAGIMVVGGKKNGLKLSFVYVIASIASRVLEIIISAIIFKAGVRWTFSIIGIAYPLVVLFAFYMNDKVKAYFGKSGEAAA